mmetsp:Transcript_13365/g.42686  ORF Transcript_13365/g.42686 Transcript_13365/m.42686 type:complete len:412 (-) Transcript_13365:161-1396(-)
MWTHVMVDEMQDVTRILYLFILQLVRRRANLLMVSDPAQSMYYWMGSDKATLEQMLHGREQYTHMLNYRSARSVIEATQPALAATGSTDTIVQIRDVDGEYRENVTFHSHPIVAGERTALLTRMAATAFEVYSVLLSKGYIHVKTVGRKSTRDNVLKLLGELEGPISSVLTRLNLRLDSSAPASQNERHDTTLALQASIAAWCKLASAGDVDALDSRTAYTAWLEKVYIEDAAAGDTLVVSTIHTGTRAGRRLAYASSSPTTCRCPTGSGSRATGGGRGRRTRSDASSTSPSRGRRTGCISWYTSRTAPTAPDSSPCGTRRPTWRPRSQPRPPRPSSLHRSPPASRMRWTRPPTAPLPCCSSRPCRPTFRSSRPPCGRTSAPPTRPSATSTRRRCRHARRSAWARAATSPR